MPEVQAERHPSKLASPQRWQEALQRGIHEGVTVRQLAGSGLWLATSGTQPDVAYELTVRGLIVDSCSCPAGEHGDDVCKHRAVWYHQAGVLGLIRTHG